LLYELLTGSTPFDTRELMQSGLDEMRRIIREQDPPRPSTRLSHMLARPDSRPIRATLDSPLSTDLDWIVMKCLEKDRTRRYQTANVLAMDVQRYLDQEPVLAVAPSRVYRFKKLVRRNRVAFLAGAAVVLALVLGLGASLWQATRATRSERQQRVLRQQAQARTYAADMNLAQQALSTHNLGRTRMLLDRHRPSEESQSRNPTSEIQDLRGWEWRYLWQQSRSGALDTLCQTSNYVHSLSVSADGNWLAAGAMQDGGLAVWDLQAKEKIATLPGGLFGVRVAFSPKEPLLAYSAITSPSKNLLKNSVFLWNGSTREIVAELPLNGECQGMAFCGDGSKLATFTGGTESQVSIWQIPEGTRFTAYATLGTQESPGHKVAFDRDLTVAASGLPDGKIMIFDPLTGAERRTVTVTDRLVNSVALSADGKRLAAATGLDDGILYLWEVGTGHQIARVEAHRGRIDALHFWPDGKRLASGSSDQTILIWDLSNLPSVSAPRRLQGHWRTILNLTLLPDNATLVSGSEDGSVLLWDTAAVRPNRTHIALSGTFVAWRWATDSRSVTTLDADGRVVRWDGIDFQQKTELMETSPNLSSGTFSADLTRLATGSHNGKMNVWDLTQGKLLGEFDGDLWPRNLLSAVDILVVKDSQNGRVKEWNLASGQEIRSWESRGRLFVDIVSGDDRWLVRCLEGDQLRLNNRMTDQEIQLNPPLRGAYGAAFSADGTHVAIASYFGLARVWATSTGQEVATFGGFEQGVHSAGFSPDGTRLATSSQGSEAMKLWDMESQRELLTLPAWEEIFISTRFSPNGNILGAMHYKQGLCLWQAPSWEDIAAAETSQGRPSE
jgi:WD40 repeat protein